MDASAFNLSGLESLRLGSVGGLIGASVNEFSTDGTLSQNSNTKVPTQNAVKTYVDTQIAGLNADKIIEGDTSVETIDSGSNGNIQFKIDAALKLQVNNDGHTIPGADSASDLGLTGTRWRNVYADNFYGSGANLTGITQTTINNNADNRIITGSGTANTLEAETGITFDGTSLGINADNDIRFTTGAWTGNAYGKIQLHNQSLYISGGSTALYSIILRVNNADKIYMKDDGTFYPTTNNVSDLGTSTYRWRNIYTTDLQLSNEGKTNDVDNTWGNYTIQEGESDLFLINNRNGKKYKFNLTEVL